MVVSRKYEIARILAVVKGLSYEKEFCNEINIKIKEVNYWNEIIKLQINDSLFKVLRREEDGFILNVEEISEEKELEAPRSAVCNQKKHSSIVKLIESLTVPQDVVFKLDYIIESLKKSIVVVTEETEKPKNKHLDQKRRHSGSIYFNTSLYNFKNN